MLLLRRFLLFPRIQLLSAAGHADMWIAGDSEEAKQTVTALLSEVGWRDHVLDAGGIAQSRALEAITVLCELLAVSRFVLILLRCSDGCATTCNTAHSIMALLCCANELHAQFSTASGPTKAGIQSTREARAFACMHAIAHLCSIRAFQNIALLGLVPSTGTCIASCANFGSSFPDSCMQTLDAPNLFGAQLTIAGSAEAI